MSGLSDGEIMQAIQDHAIDIQPFNFLNLQPASIDLTLGTRFLWYKHPQELLEASYPIDPQVNNAWRMEEGVFSEDFPFVIKPGQFVLATTVEKVKIGHALIGRLEGKSSLARLGLAVHVTAGFFDPGFEGDCTLELVNHAPSPILLRPGMRIVQMSFQRLGRHVQRPYGHPGLKSKYQGQSGPTTSRYHLNVV